MNKWPGKKQAHQCSCLGRNRFQPKDHNSKHKNRHGKALILAHTNVEIEQSKPLKFCPAKSKTRNSISPEIQPIFYILSNPTWAKINDDDTSPSKQVNNTNHDIKLLKARKILMSNVTDRNHYRRSTATFENQANEMRLAFHALSMRL